MGSLQGGSCKHRFVIEVGPVLRGNVTVLQVLPAVRQASWAEFLVFSGLLTAAVCAGAEERCHSQQYSNQGGC